VLLAVLLLGAAVAQAEPSFVLLDTQAGPGALVHFSISGSEERGSFSVEVADEEVAEGSLPAESTYSGSFTMPDLGGASRSVTVEAQITQSDETTARARNLHYVVEAEGGSAASTPPVEQALATAPVAAPASTGRPTSSSPARRSAGKRHARSAPRRHSSHAPRRRSAAPQLAKGADNRPGRAHISSSRGHRGQTAAQAGVGKRPLPAPRSTGGSPGQSGVNVGSDVPTRLTTFLTAPPTGIFSLASGVAGDNAAEFPVAALIILPLLCLTALMLVGGGFTPRARSDRFRFVPSSPKTPSANGHAPTRAVPEPAAVPSDAELEAMAASLREAAASFQAIPLAVLDQRAELSTRAERKYILDLKTFERLVGELAGNYLILEIEDERVFPYDTVYFDTPELITYHQHLQERRRRFKCRTRRYSSKGPCFFEIKLKGGRGETIKSRLPLDVEEHGLLTAPALAYLEHELHAAYRGAAPAGLEPALRTSYRRLTLVSSTGGERLTFDFDLEFATNGSKHAIQPGRILLENKTATANGDTGSRPGGAKGVLRRLGVRPVGSCSKYCLGVALAHPELRNNRFRPLIRRHFDPNQPATLRDRHVVPDVADRRDNGTAELGAKPADVYINDVGPWVELPAPNFLE
jgi:VTC domain-containing protein